MKKWQESRNPEAVTDGRNPVFRKNEYKKTGSRT